MHTEYGLVGMQVIIGIEVLWSWDSTRFICVVGDKLEQKKINGNYTKNGKYIFELLRAYWPPEHYFFKEKIRKQVMNCFFISTVQLISVNK